MRETNTQTLFQVSLLWRYFTSKELNNLSCFKTTRLDSDINGFGRSCIMASHLRVIQFFDYSRLVLAIGTRLIVIIKPSHLCPASCDSMSSVLQKRRSGICSDAWIPLFMYIIYNHPPLLCDIFHRDVADLSQIPRLCRHKLTQKATKILSIPPMISNIGADFHCFSKIIRNFAARMTFVPYVGMI